MSGSEDEDEDDALVSGNEHDEDANEASEGEAGANDIEDVDAELAALEAADAQAMKTIYRSANDETEKAECVKHQAVRCRAAQRKLMRRLGVATRA
ncbi:hypothetical protein EON66_08230 [archaeon]|nr:MAG: hypothetical protein EON66_08230 [archaeon]